MRASSVVERAVENQFAARFAAAGPELDEIDPRRGSPLPRARRRAACCPCRAVLHHADEPAGVARMQADAGLIEDEERVHQRRAEAGREIHALDFAAAERARRAVEREIAEADFDEIAEARARPRRRSIVGRGVMPDRRLSRLRAARSRSPTGIAISSGSVLPAKRKLSVAG